MARLRVAVPFRVGEMGRLRRVGEVYDESEATAVWLVDHGYASPERAEAPAAEAGRPARKAPQRKTAAAK